MLMSPIFLMVVVEETFEGEERILYPSPRVKTYDKKPEMSAYEVKNQVLKKFKNEKP